MHLAADELEATLAAAVPSSPAQESKLEYALRLAKEATNGWACYAKRQIEHDEIARLHRAIAVAQEGKR